MGRGGPFIQHLVVRPSFVSIQRNTEKNRRAQVKRIRISNSQEVKVVFSYTLVIRFRIEKVSRGHRVLFRSEFQKKAAGFALLANSFCRRQMIILFCICPDFLQRKINCTGSLTQSIFDASRSGPFSIAFNGASSGRAHRALCLLYRRDSSIHYARFRCTRDLVPGRRHRRTLRE